MKTFNRVLVASALALAVSASPALAAKGGNGNGNNGNGRGNGGSTPAPTPAPAPAPAPAPTPTPAPAPAPTMASCESTRGTVIADFTACYGFVQGNAFGGSQAKVDLQNLGLSSLGSALTIVRGGSTGDATGWDDIQKVTTLSGPNGDFIDFGQQLTGQKIIGVHFGNVAGPYQNVSVFWLVDFTNSMATTGVKLNNIQGFSNAQLYHAFPNTMGGVPEPSAWALMVLAFGAVGGAMRTSRTRRAASLAKA